MAVDKTIPGSVAQTVEPLIRQVFITSNSPDQEVFRRQIYLLRKLTSRVIPDEGLRFYLVSLSLDTVVYKVAKCNINKRENKKGEGSNDRGGEKVEKNIIHKTKKKW